MKSSQIIATFILLGFCLSLVSIPANLAYAQDPSPSPTLWQRIQGKLIPVKDETGLSEINIWNLIGKIIKFVLLFVGIIFLILMLYSGFLWMTAGGSSDQVKKATSTMKNSAIGLVIIFLSYAITITIFDVLFKSAT